MPSKLLFGVAQRGEQVDELTEYLEAENTDDVNLQHIRNESSRAIDHSQTYAADRAKKMFKPAKKYDVGNFVVIRNVDTVIGSNKKLIPKYRGRS